ncbi:MAG: hypothetical protein Q7S59_05030 [Sulfurimonas sp.]|nr:hypothetical protein [Sulfurimonas sp.]
MRNIKYIGMGLAIALILGFSGCGDSGSSSANVPSSDSTSKFDRATLINLGDLTDYNLITNDSGTSNLKRSVTTDGNSGNSNEKNNIALKLTNNTANSIKNSLLNLKQSNGKKSLLARAVTQNGDIKTVDEVENGNISGDKTLHLDVNIVTGALSGSIIYNNYKNSESNSCSANETTSMVGVWNVTGTMDLVTFQTVILNLSTNANIYIDEMIIKSGMTMTIAYNRTSLFEEDAITT